MNFGEVANAGYSIGSDAVESGNRMLVTKRLKRSGQRRGRDGGQVVPTYLALLKSGRIGRAWSMHSKSWQKWKPPAPANNNQALMALAA